MMTDCSNQYNQCDNDKLPCRTTLISQQKYMQPVRTIIYHLSRLISSDLISTHYISSQLFAVAVTNETRRCDLLQSDSS